MIEAPFAKRIWVSERSVRPVASIRLFPVIRRICPTDPSMAACSAARSFVVPSPFTPKDVSSMTPGVLALLAPCESVAGPVFVLVLVSAFVLVFAFVFVPVLVLVDGLDTIVESAALAALAESALLVREPRADPESAMDDVLSPPPQAASASDPAPRTSVERSLRRILLGAAIAS